MVNRPNIVNVLVLDLVYKFIGRIVELQVHRSQYVGDVGCDGAEPMAGRLLSETLGTSSPIIAWFPCVASGITWLTTSIPAFHQRGEVSRSSEWCLIWSSCISNSKVYLPSLNFTRFSCKLRRATDFGQLRRGASGTSPLTVCGVGLELGPILPVTSNSGTRVAVLAALAAGGADFLNIHTTRDLRWI